MTRKIVNQAIPNVVRVDWVYHVNREGIEGPDGEWLSGAESAIFEGLLENTYRHKGRLGDASAWHAGAARKNGGLGAQQSL